MPQPTPSAVHVDVPLSNISIAFRNSKYVADQLFPIVLVDKESDKYFVWTKDFWFRNHTERRGPGGLFPEAGFELSTTDYLVVNKALSVPIPDEVVANQDAAVNIETAGAEFLADQFMLDREIDCKTVIMDASAWTNSTTLSGTSQWSDFENSTPLENVNTGIETMKKATGLKPNTAFMGVEVWAKLRRHPDLLDLYKYTTTGILDQSQVAKALDIDRIVIGDAIRNTSNEGQTFSGSFIWDKNCILMYIAPTPGLLTPSAGYTFVWKRTTGLPITIERIRDDMRKRDILRGEHAYVHKVTSADCGYEIVNAVA